MLQINFIARAISGITSFGFLIAGIFDVLDYFIVKLFLFGIFTFLVVYVSIKLYENEKSPKP